MARWGPWTLYDPQTDETWVMDIGPAEAAELIANLKAEDGASNQAGQTVIIEQATEVGPAAVVEHHEAFPESIQISNYAIEQSHVETLEDWASRDYTLHITDQHERTYAGVIGELSYDRTAEQTGLYPWIRKWTMTFWVSSVLSAALPLPGDP